MQKCCLNLKLKSKKYQKYFYCNKANKEINLDQCKNCIFKEYKRANPPKKTISADSIMPNMIIHASSKPIECYNWPVKYYHKHHIFGGKNRNNSERYGLYVYVKWDDHILEKNSFHGDPKIQLKLKVQAQKEFKSRYPDLNFQQIFGRNYL